MKKVLAGLICVGSLLSAQTINLNPGWNFVSIVEDVTYTKTDLINDLSSIQNILGFNGTQTLLASAITNIEPNKAYWIKIGDSSDSFSVSGNSTALPTLQLGWNAVGFSTTKTLSEWLTNMTNNGYTVSNIIGFNGTQTILASGISEVESGKGYWVKVDQITTPSGEVIENPETPTGDNPPPQMPGFTQN